MYSSVVSCNDYDEVVMIMNGGIGPCEVWGCRHLQIEKLN